ncbi:MAG: hypothetical protein K8M05_09300 [Deltaproteobacteria bacterium]|nr:hypothetical protein [Kofleriaceae bacterium]
MLTVIVGLLMASLVVVGAAGCKFPELPPLQDDGAIDGSEDGATDSSDSTTDSAPVDAPPGPFLFSFGGTGVDTARAAVNSNGEIAIAGVMGAPTTIDSESVAAGLYVVKLAVDGSVAWVSGFEGGALYVNGVALGENGDVFVAGRLDGTLSFGASSLISSGPDGVLIHLSSTTGAVLQTRLISGSSSTTFENWDGLNAIAVDSAGNVYVTGHFSGSGSPCGNQRTSAGNWDVFIARYSNMGLNCQWDRVYGSVEQDVGNAIATDGVGVFVGVSSFGTLNAGGSTLTAGSSSDVVVARYAAVSGAHSWSFRFHGAGENPRAVTTGDGGVFFAGTLTGQVSFGGTTIGGSQAQELFLLRFNSSNGAHAWSKSVPGGSTLDTIHSLSFSNGGIHLAGAFTGDANFGGQGFVAAGTHDAFRAAYDLPNGTHLSSTRSGGTGQDEMSLSVPTQHGHVLVGTFSGTVMLGSEQRTASGNTDVFVLRQ